MKAKSIIYLLILQSFICGLSLQAQPLIFAKVFYNDNAYVGAYSAVKTHDNYYMIAGRMNNDALLLKMDSTGSILWAKSYSLEGNSRFNQIISLKDSNFLIAGYYGNSVSNMNYFLIEKVTSGGDTLWTKMISTGTESSSALSVKQTNDDGFLVSGFTDYLSPPVRSVLAKLDPEGNLAWCKLITEGSLSNYIYSGKQTPDSGYIVCGYIERLNPDITTGATFIKLTKDGDITWAIENNITSPEWSGGYDAYVLPDGLLFYFFTSNDGIVLLKTDFSGNSIWSVNYPSFYGSYTTQNPSPKLHRTTDGGFAFIVTDGESDNSLLVKIDSSGNINWGKELYLSATEVMGSNDKGFMITGNGPLLSVNITGTNNPQIGIIKTDSLGLSAACVYGVNSDKHVYTGSFIPVVLTAETTGTVASLHPVINNVSLTTESGCVPWLSKVQETNHRENQIQIYPNPTSGILQFQSNWPMGAEFQSVQIYNSAGEKIFQSNDPSILNLSVDLTFAPDGIYLVRIIFSDQYLSRKFIKSR